jgi:hypothetical protein
MQDDWEQTPQIMRCQSPERLVSTALPHAIRVRDILWPYQPSGVMMKPSPFCKRHSGKLGVADESERDHQSSYGVHTVVHT